MIKSITFSSMRGGFSRCYGIRLWENRNNSHQRPPEWLSSSTDLNPPPQHPLVICHFHALSCHIRSEWLYGILPSGKIPNLMNTPYKGEEIHSPPPFHVKKYGSDRKTIKSNAQCRMHHADASHTQSQRQLRVNAGAKSQHVSEAHSYRIRSESKDYKTCSSQPQRNLESLQHHPVVLCASISIPSQGLDNGVTHMGSNHGYNLWLPMSTTCHTSKPPPAALFCVVRTRASSCTAKCHRC